MLFLLTKIKSSIYFWSVKKVKLTLFRLQVVEGSSLVSVLFSEAFSHPYISFFHLLVNVFSVTCLPPFF